MSPNPPAGAFPDRTPDDWQAAPEAERDAEILRLRTAGHSLHEIAMRVGYAAASTVHRRIEAAYVRTVRESADLARDIDLRRLDAALEHASAIMTAKHYAVSGGRVVRRRLTDEHGLWIPLGVTDNGKPLYVEEDVTDPAPVLAAIDRIVKILERRAKLLRLDPPTQHEVLSVSQIDAEIRALTERLTAAGLPPELLADLADTEQE